MLLPNRTQIAHGLTSRFKAASAEPSCSSADQILSLAEDALRCLCRGQSRRRSSLTDPVLKVYLTIDTEVWCNGWEAIDDQFPLAFQRYVYGRSAHGDFALPKTLEILNRFGLKAVFFVEALFSARFGSHYLQEIVQLIDRAGHDVQLHVHPEWSDEIHPPLVKSTEEKFQSLSQLSESDQFTLISWAKNALEQSLGRPVTAFRAGNYAASRSTLRALRRAGIRIDSSLNECMAGSGTDVPALADYVTARVVDGVLCYPVSTFRDGLGIKRPLHVNGCSFEELRDALFTAAQSGWEHFVIVSHNFEMLRRGSHEPDHIVVDRFTRLCELLADYPALFQVCSYSDAEPSTSARPATAKFLSTGQRHLEQIRRLATL